VRRNSKEFFLRIMKWRKWHLIFKNIFFLPILFDYSIIFCQVEKQFFSFSETHFFDLRHFWSHECNVIDATNQIPWSKFLIGCLTRLDPMIRHYAPCLFTSQSERDREISCTRRVSCDILVCAYREYSECWRVPHKEVVDRGIALIGLHPWMNERPKQ